MSSDRWVRARAGNYLRLTQFFDRALGNYIDDKETWALVLERNGASLIVELLTGSRAGTGDYLLSDYLFPTHIVDDSDVGDIVLEHDVPDEVWAEIVKWKLTRAY